MLFLRLSVLMGALFATPVVSHEFWIEPQEFQVNSGDAVTADLKNGEAFKGITLAWFDHRFTRFETVQGTTVRAVEGRLGDTPAFTGTAENSGLMIIAHETVASNITYKEWDKFLKFVQHKDFVDAVATHEKQGWSKDEFRESYTRHAKALVAIDDGTGADRALGLATEFVALTNPYEQGFEGDMHIRLLYQGDPRADAQVEVFEKSAEGDVVITLHRTNAAGEARIPVKKGYSYLFDAVVLRPSSLAGTEERAPVWETLWAALTFAVPDGEE